VLEEAIDNKANSNNANAPIKPIAAGSIFFLQTLDSKKLGLADVIACLIA
jgi:hypothetical protein